MDRWVRRAGRPVPGRPKGEGTVPERVSALARAPSSARATTGAARCPPRDATARPGKRTPARRRCGARTRERLQGACGPDADCAAWLTPRVVGHVATPPATDTVRRRRAIPVHSLRGHALQASLCVHKHKTLRIPEGRRCPAWLPESLPAASAVANHLARGGRLVRATTRSKCSKYYTRPSSKKQAPRRSRAVRVASAHGLTR